MEKTPLNSLVLRISDTVKNVPKSILWGSIYIGTLANIGLLIFVLGMWYSPYGYVAKKIETDPEFKAWLFELHEQSKNATR